MTFSISRKEVYIPSAAGNDKADTPVKFHIRYLTVEEREELKAIYFPIKKNGKVGEVEMKLYLNDIFRRCVEKIEGLIIEEDGKSQSIESAADFLNLPGEVFHEMMAEVAARIKNKAAVDLKN